MLNKTKLILCHSTILYNFILVILLREYGSNSCIRMEFQATIYLMFTKKTIKVEFGLELKMVSLCLMEALQGKYGSSDGLPSADIIKITDINGRLFVATSGQGVYVLKMILLRK